MNILITGGCGFIGSNLATHLSSKHQVTVIDNLSTGRISNISGLAIKFIELDLLNYSKIEELLKINKFHAIIHLAAIASVQKSKEFPLEANEVNFISAIRLLNSAANCGVNQFIFASSAAVYGDNELLPKSESTSIIQPISTYGIDKFAVEQYVLNFAKERKIRATAFRFFNVFGPNQDPSSPYSGVLSIFLDEVLNKQEPSVTIFGDGKQTRDFTYVKDIVRTIEQSLIDKNYNSNVLNLATGIETSLLKVVEHLEKLSGKKIKINFKPKRVGDIFRSVADISKIQHLGYQPEYTFESGLKEYFEHLSANS